MTDLQLKDRLNLPQLVGPVKGTTAGAARLYLDLKDGIIRNWMVQDRAGRLLWLCPECLSSHWWYPNAVYDQRWGAAGGTPGECCERGMRKLFEAERKLWTP